MEDLGVTYFHELFSWSLFQRSSHNETEFVMHNLNVDLACHVGGDMYCILEEGGSYLEVISERTRHFSFTSHVEDVFKKFETYKEANFLRTFLALSTAAPEDDEAVCSKTTRVLDELLAKFKCLRILSLRGCQIGSYQIQLLA